MPLTYEKHILSAEDHPSTIKEICNFIGVSVPEEPPETNLRKISPKTLRDSIENYDEIKSSLENTKYAQFLDED